MGHGDAILIREGPLAALIDAGLPDDGIVERLRALGVDSLRVFIASHNHGDHIGSGAAILLAFPVKLFIGNGAPSGADVAARSKVPSTTETKLRSSRSTNCLVWGQEKVGPGVRIHLQAFPIRLVRREAAERDQIPRRVIGPFVRRSE